MIERLQHIFFGESLASRIVRHGLYWMLSFYVLIRIFSYTDLYTVGDVLYTFLFAIPLVVVVYININFLIPRFLQQNRYVPYILLLICLCGFGTFLIMIIFDHLQPLLFPQYYFILDFKFLTLVQYPATFIVLTTLIKLSKGWFLLSRLERKLAQAQEEKLDAEIKALKAQINPHFLFNSLNSIYAEAIEGSNKTPKLLLKLSDTLRYVLYEADQQFVPLEKDINHLRDYIDLQKARHDDAAEIDCRITGDFKRYQIAPLILLPIVENGFKHGIERQRGKPRLEILIEEMNGTLTLKTKNLIDRQQDIKSGIGHENIMKRLELIYPNRHKMKLVESNGNFEVNLQIRL